MKSERQTGSISITERPPMQPNTQVAADRWERLQPLSARPATASPGPQPVPSPSARWLPSPPLLAGLVPKFRPPALLLHRPSLPTRRQNLHDSRQHHPSWARSARLRAANTPVPGLGLCDASWAGHARRDAAEPRFRVSGNTDLHRLRDGLLVMHDDASSQRQCALICLLLMILHTLGLAIRHI